MTNPYKFIFKPGHGLDVSLVEQDLMTDENAKKVEASFDTKRYLRNRYNEDANREDLEYLEECREDKMAWDVDESQT